MWRLQRVFAVFGELGQMIGDDHSLGGQSNGFDKLVGGFERKRYWGGYRLVTRRGLSERLWCCLRVVSLR